MNAQELVIQHPLGLDVMVRVVAHDRAGESPGAGHMVNQIVVPLCRRLCMGGVHPESEEHQKGAGGGESHGKTSRQEFPSRDFTNATGKVF